MRIHSHSAMCHIDVKEATPSLVLIVHGSFGCATVLETVAAQ